MDNNASLVIIGKNRFSLTADIIHSDAGGTDQARLSPQIISDIKYNTSTFSVIYHT